MELDQPLAAVAVHRLAVGHNCASDTIHVS
jgi:hypothetical protein